MRLAVVIVALFATVALCSIQTDLLSKWSNYKTQFGKSYNAIEENKRFAIFQTNIQRVAQMNADHGEPYPFGITQFMDLTPQEFKAKYLMKVPVGEMPDGDLADVPQANPPAVWDWAINKTGIVTPVKNQGQCGSCWAFSATEEIESMWALKHSEVVLGPQQIVDCDTVDQGCNGGFPYDAYKYVMKAGGQEPASDYPYTARDGTCKFKSADVAVKIANWSYVITSPAQENTTLLNFIGLTAPASVCVYAEPWQYYNGGVLKSGCPSKKSMIDHCVQLTGYGVVNGLPVWHVRNSWGTTWGEAGYITLLRGQNLCSIASMVTTVTVN